MSDINPELTMLSRPYAILNAPSALGLSSEGVEHLGERLLELGLQQAIGARLAGRLAVPRKDPERDPGTGVLNAAAIADWSPRLADAVGAILDVGEFPVVLGGDCTILIGPMLALRRRGRYGLLFIDGHADFFQPEAEPNGEGASMDLAWAAGYGPDLLTDIEGRKPLVRAEDVVAFGFRDHADQAEYGSQPLPGDLRVHDLPKLRETGVEAAARDAVDHLTQDQLDGFFIHFDADVLDDAVMPAVDFRRPGGLSWDEVQTALRIALDSGRAVGLAVTIYNPLKDEDGRAGQGLVDVLAKALGKPQPKRR